MNPYKVLGIKKNAKPDVIKKAYRDKAKESHPDINDGDDKAFLEVKAAYDTLIDPRKRAIFDKHGFVPGYENGPSIEQASNQIRDMFLAFLEQCSPEQLNHLKLVNLMKDGLCTNKAQLEKNYLQIKLKQGNLEHHRRILEKRLKCKGEKNIFMDTLNASALLLAHSLRQTDLQLNIMSLAIELLDDYEYTHEVMQQIGWSNTASTTSMGGLGNIFGGFF